MRNFLFDIGNVILFFDFGVAVRRVADRCSLDEDRILPSLSPLTEAFERGEMSTAEFVAEASRRIGFGGSGDELVAALEDIFTVNEPMVEIIESLHAAGHPLFLLSNTNAIHVPYFTRRYPVFERFAGATYSHEVGAMKPDPAIYRAAIETFDLAPENTVYIDDLPANVAAGTSHGLLSLCYRSEKHADLVAELERLTTAN